MLEGAIIVALVRVVAFALGGLLAYFGYRLFAMVPQQDESGAKIETPGLTITLSRIAPGTFFAACAAGIAIASFIYPIKIGEGEKGVLGASPSAQSAVDIQRGHEVREGAGASPSTATANAEHIRSALLHLACLRDAHTLDEDQKAAIDQARVALMARLWMEEWGEFEAFETWALEQRGAAPVTAVEYVFTRKDRRCPS